MGIGDPYFAWSGFVIHENELNSGDTGVGSNVNIEGFIPITNIGQQSLSENMQACSCGHADFRQYHKRAISVTAIVS